MTRRFSVVQSTEQLFTRSGNDLAFYGAYAHVRKKLDYSFHAHYTKSRQWLHDSIVEDYLLNESASSHGGGDNQDTVTMTCAPWLLLTVGVQGAGKRHTVDELARTGRLPLLSFVCVDTGTLLL
jgi:signal recognition particle GTPase